MNKKMMSEKRFYKTIAIVMMVVLVITTVLPALPVTTVRAAGKTKSPVQLQIGRKKVTKKTYRMRQGMKKKLKVTGKDIKSVRFHSDKKRVVSVSKTGVIHAKKKGVAKITAVVKMSLDQMATGRIKRGKKTVWMKVRVAEDSRRNLPGEPDVITFPGVADPSETVRPVNMPSLTEAPMTTPDRAETSDPAFVPTPSASSTPSGEQRPSSHNSKILIAYFTRSGNTEILADSIGEKTGGIKFKIETVKSYPEDYNGVLAEAMQEKNENARPELKTTVDNMAEYDTVFVGASDIIRTS